MLALARFAMRGPLFAAAAGAALALASLGFGLLLIPAGAVVALATLRHGAREGAKVAATAASFVMVVRLGLGQGLAPSLVLCSVAWLPAWTMAALLRERRAQTWPLLMGAAAVWVYAFGLRLAVGDVEAFWRMLLTPLFDAVAKDAGAKFSAEQLAYVVSQAHGWSLVGMQLTLAAMILLARWWQAALYNPGGFGAEFRELRLPRGLALVTGAVALLYGLAGGATGFALAGDACVILVVLFALQGLAVIHFVSRMKSMAAGWLTTMYVLLVLVPQVAGPILATTGLADDIADFRRLRRGQRP